MELSRLKTEHRHMKAKLYAYSESFTDRFLNELATDKNLPADVRHEAVYQLKKRVKKMQTAIAHFENDIPTGEHLEPIFNPISERWERFNQEWNEWEEIEDPKAEQL